MDAVLRLYDVEPAGIPAKGRMPVRSADFRRRKISRRCRNLLREKGSIRADDVVMMAHSARRRRLKQLLA